MCFILFILAQQREIKVAVSHHGVSSCCELWDSSWLRGQSVSTMQLAWVCPRMQLSDLACHVAVRQGLVAHIVHGACVSLVYAHAKLSRPFSQHRDVMQVAVADARQTTGRRLAAGFAVKTLSSIMRELRHEWVDIVKVSSSPQLAPAFSKHIITFSNVGTFQADTSMHAPEQSTMLAC